MNEQAKTVWNSQQGQSLFKAMLSGQPKTAEHQQALQQLKQADPPKAQQQGKPQVK